MSRRPRVLFVCVKNGGESQMAAGLMHRRSAGSVEVDSAGTQPGTAINLVSETVLAELGIDISHAVPKAVTSDAVEAADLVVTPGREAHVEAVGGTPVANWDTDEPSERGTEGLERMRLVRDDIDRHVQQLLVRLQPAGNSSS